MTSSVWADPPEKPPAPAPKVDRVGFPKSYAETFEVLRIVNKPDELKVVTVYGNKAAASVTNAQQLPYPNGSVIVMETAHALKDPEGKMRKDLVTGLHVMRRGAGFGQAYGENRAGEWEFVEYKLDASYITPPEKSAKCAQCHVKAGPTKDFVFQARLASKPEK